LRHAGRREVVVVDALVRRVEGLGANVDVDVDDVADIEVVEDVV
jgi:hypothetical protein